MRHSTLIILLSLFTNLSAQQPNKYTFRHIDQTDGLLHNDVFSICQDTKGFMWMLTANGLQRYDGTRFINYPDIVKPGIIQLGELYTNNKTNELWVSKRTAIEKLDLPNNRFRKYDVEQVLNDPAFKYDAYINEYNNRCLLGEKGMFVLSAANNTISSYVLNIHPLQQHKSNQIARDSMRNQTWVIENNGMFLFDGNSRKVFSIRHNPLHHPVLQYFSLRKIHPRIIMIDSRSNLWISTWGSLFYRFNQKTGTLSSYNLSSIKKRHHFTQQSDITLLINSIFEDNNANLWIATENAGLLLYHKETDDFENIIVDNKNVQSIDYNFKIYSITQDKEENIWLGTDKGISIFNPYRQYFTAVRPAENRPSLPKSEILDIIQTGTRDILVGTWGGGIAVYDDQWRFKKNILFPHPHQYNMVYSFIRHDDGNIWAGCQHGHIHIYNPATESIKTIHPPELGGSTILCMTKDAEGNIWFGLHNGRIAQWNKIQNKFYPFNDSLKIEIGNGAFVIKMYIDKSQRFWVSTGNGFKEFDPERMVYSQVFLPDKNNPNAISAEYCHSIEAYDDTTLLIGTRNGGLNFFNSKTQTFRHDSTHDELLSGSIYAIKKDADGYIWFTTDYNLYKLNPENKEFIRYNMEPGILTSSFQTTGFYTLQDGTWLTASTTDILRFHPAAEIHNNNHQKVEIAGFKIFDSPFFIDSLLYQNKPIALTYKQNFFTIEFALPNFANLQQAKYYYRLSGVDADWVNAEAKNFASYTNLAPGKYVFSVKMKNGRVMSQATSFTINISPPFWQTWWFRSIILCCILALIYLIVKWREKNIKIIETQKLKVQQLSAEQYKSKLELERIINYFTSSLIDKNTVDDVLWDVAKNLIGRIGFVDCMIYLWDDDKSKMIQKAGFGPKGSIEGIKEQPFDVVPGQGVVGYVMQTKEPVLIPDTSKDNRYRPDEMERLSEITVPIIYNNELIGVIDSEHHEKNFYTPQHLQILSTIATLMANKIKSIEAEQILLQTHIEMYSMNEQLSKAKLEALRAQMNPHFIFNCLNSIDNLIQMDEKEKATLYLSKFARLIRSILENATNDTVDCWKDMETLQLYLELEALRFDNKFSYQVNIADEIMNGDYKVPPLVIQPFVENAIHHGLLNKIEHDKKLRVDVSVSGNHIYYLIEDNGVGRAKAASYKQLNKQVYESKGMQITADRINLFNQHTNGSVVITDLRNESGSPAGTKVEVDLINYP
jgi:ligand-binding sensor domain-containing protein/putative methionine-R-sulfoxide reductase with GAF domain